jgi:mRNA interferase MazF
LGRHSRRQLGGRLNVADPLRGEIWTVNLNPTRGREQLGTRPALVVSTDQFNQGPAGLVVVLPITGTARGIPLHVRIDPPEGGVKKLSFVKCEDVRSISKERLGRRWGRVSPNTLADIEDRIRILLEL